MTTQRRQGQRRAPQTSNGSEPAAEAETELESADATPIDDTTPAAPDSAPVKLRISPDMLRQLLRLRREVAITSATRDIESGLIEFGIESPSAPPDAVELLVTYRHTGGTDPIHAVSTWSTEPATP